MTIAEKDAYRKQRLDNLQTRIRAILTEKEKPMSLDEILYRLQTARFEEGEALDSDNPFDVRDAISALVRAGEAKEVVGRDIELNRK